jgi:hypothetical protein
VVILGFGLSSCEKESVVPEGDLPTVAQQYISTHFPNVQVLQVVKDIDGLSKSYEVYLDGFQLEFSRSGDITNVKSNRQQAIPNSTVPVKILEYVNAQYSGSAIWEWEKDDSLQEVKLSNGLELVFSKSGDFIRIDS